jgi:hypothetical protein
MALNVTSLIQSIQVSSINIDKAVDDEIVKVKLTLAAWCDTTCIRPTLSRESEGGTTKIIIYFDGRIHIRKSEIGVNET